MEAVGGSDIVLAPGRCRRLLSYFERSLDVSLALYATSPRDRANRRASARLAADRGDNPWDQILLNGDQGAEYQVQNDAVHERASEDLTFLADHGLVPEDSVLL